MRHSVIKRDVIEEYQGSVSVFGRSWLVTERVVRIQVPGQRPDWQLETAGQHGVRPEVRHYRTRKAALADLHERIWWHRERAQRRRDMLAGCCAEYEAAVEDVEL